MGLIEIKKELRAFDKEKIIGIVAELYKNNKRLESF